MNKGDIQKLMKLGQCENVFKELFEADTVTVTSQPHTLHDEGKIQKKHMVVINNY